MGKSGGLESRCSALRDDAISSKTKPSLRVLHPIEDAYFYQSYLRGRQDYGHQAVAVMLSCNGIALDYAIVMYDEFRSKVEIVHNIAAELSMAPIVSYFLCDSWYTCGGIMDAFIKKGILYYWGTENKLCPVHLLDKTEG